MSERQADAEFTVTPAMIEAGARVASQSDLLTPWESRDLVQEIFLAMLAKADRTALARTVKFMKH
jgi:hypothetical protein